MIQATILIVEDEEDIASLIAHHMKGAGFTPIVAYNGAAALKEVEKQLPDLILLDLMLPDMDGTEVCRILKQKEATKGIPVIMVTAKAEEVDRIVGLELGADDYVVKPFSTRELVLRVKGILKRVKAPTDKPNVLKHGELILDIDAHKVSLSGQEIELTLTEFKLLRELLLNKRRIRPREVLLNNVWGYTFEGYDRTVDTHIQRLRHKLGTYGNIIETVRGIGYIVK